MITKTQPTYRCEFCRKLYVVERHAVQHETRCSKNPANNRPCFSCKFLEKRDTFVYDDGWNGEYKTAVVALYCTKYEEYRIPPKAIHRGNAYEFGDVANEPMPIECDGHDADMPF